jgi:hypothetical protein
MIEGTDERLCVDCRYGDNSSVFHVDMLDDIDEWTERFPGRPWLFDTDESPVQAFATEDEACAAQRAYRVAKGFDPITGE